MQRWPNSSFLDRSYSGLRTYRAVQLQIRTMGQSTYELEIHQPSQHMILRICRVDQILASIPWLRHNPMTIPTRGGCVLPFFHFFRQLR